MATTIKTTGAEWTQFMSDPWPDDKWMDDEQLEVDGEPFEGDTDGIPDTAVVKIVAGVVYDGDKERSLVAEFAAWRKRQNTETFTVIADKSKVAAVNAAIVAAVGKVQ